VTNDGSSMEEYGSPRQEARDPGQDPLLDPGRISREAETIFSETLARSIDGDPVAHCLLGDFYRNGFGVDQSYGEAKTWYQRAAEQGNVEAQVNLGMIYLFGPEAQKDHRHAFQWLSRAAEQGSSQARSCLGIMYLGRHGIEENRTEAWKLLSRASEGGKGDNYTPSSIPLRPIGADNYGRFPGDAEASLLSP